MTFLSRNRSSCVAEQVHRVTSLKAVVRRAPNNSKNCQWATEGDDYDGRIRIKRYAGERCLPECVIERHSGLTTALMDVVEGLKLADQACVINAMPNSPECPGGWKMLQTRSLMCGLRKTLCEAFYREVQERTSRFGIEFETA
ncbi:NACHT and WD repeat domain-containing protein 2 [Trichonephila clavipes]|nr:NACHT and WD repeat domain-containing protein 2 [Trichonephila clavipes]